MPIVLRLSHLQKKKAYLIPRWQHQILIHSTLRQSTIMRKYVNQTASHKSINRVTPLCCLSGYGNIQEASLQKEEAFLSIFKQLPYPLSRVCFFPSSFVAP